jgi:serine/threonine protein kinase
MYTFGDCNRDIKPNNLLVSGKPFCWERLRISDFGLAGSIMTHSIASCHSSVGTTSYVAPEVLFGLPEDESVDVYAAGR